MAPEAPEGPGGGAEHQAERRNLQRRSERPEQPPVPAAGQTLHTQGKMTFTRSFFMNVIFTFVNSLNILFTPSKAILYSCFCINLICKCAASKLCLNTLKHNQLVICGGFA